MLGGAYSVVGVTLAWPSIVTRHFRPKPAPSVVVQFNAVWSSSTTQVALYSSPVSP